MSKVQIAPHLQGRQGAELKDPWWLTPKRQRAGAVKMTVAGAETTEGHQHAHPAKGRR